MSIDLIPDSIRANYEIYEWRHATAILNGDFNLEFAEILQVLAEFKLRKSDILTPGGRKSPIAGALDGELLKRGWEEKKFATEVVVDSNHIENPTHAIDCYKNRVALEVEWNNKDPFYDRDLNNFRVLFELRAISVGVLITRCDGLQGIFDRLGKGKSYGASTTHISRLLPRVNGGGGGGCPILVFGISEELYVNDD